jgi:membrane protease YdiL (CAAX protease family)
MELKSPAKDKAEIHSATKQLLVFYGLAFVISWIIWGSLIFIPVLDEMYFFVILGAYGPLLAAWITTLIFAGKEGVKAWRKRVFGFKIGWRTVLLAALAFPIFLAFVHLLVYVFFEGAVQLSSDPPWWWAVSVFPINMVVTSLFSSSMEEPGWQGFALPHLTRKVHPILANLIHGILWAAWHLPLYLTPAWSGNEPFIWLLLYTTSLSMIFFWLTNNSRRSVVPSILAHSASNLYGSLFLGTTIFTQGLATNFSLIKTCMYWAIALVLLIRTQGRLGHVVTEE